MTYRSVLLHIDEGPDVDAQSEFAAWLARMFDAKATGAKLLVMGAWGRPRVVERLLGGATREVLAGLNVPTLFAR